MTRNTLVRYRFGTAITGGTLRVVDVLLANADIHLQNLAYFATDLMLIFALCRVYPTRSHRLGLLGLLGFAASITGLLVVCSFGPSVYLLGATVTLLGVARSPC